MRSGSHVHAGAAPPHRVGSPGLRDASAVAELFVGVFLGGIVYADRSQSESGHYKRLVFLPYGTLKLELKEDCPSELRAQIYFRCTELAVPKWAEMGFALLLSLKNLRF